MKIKNKSIQQHLEKNNMVSRFCALALGEMIESFYLEDNKKNLPNIISTLDTKRYDFKLKYPEEYQNLVRILKKIVYNRVIESPKHQELMSQNKTKIKEFFDLMINNIIVRDEILKDFWHNKAIKKVQDDRPQVARIICDFISGCTDQYFLNIYKKYCKK